MVIFMKQAGSVSLFLYPFHARPTMPSFIPILCVFARASRLWLVRSRGQRSCLLISVDSGSRVPGTKEGPIIAFGK